MIDSPSAGIARDQPGEKKGWSLYSRLTATAGALAAVGGLSVVMWNAGAPDQSISSALMMPIGDAIAISAPLRLSRRLPLTIDSGSILSAGVERGSGGVAIDEAAITLDLSERGGKTAASAEIDAPPTKTPRIAGFASGNLRLTRALVTVIGPNGVTTRLTDVNATIAASRKGSYKLSATGRLNDQPIAVDAVWGEAVASEQAAQLPIRITLRSPVLELSLEGLFKDSARPHFTGEAEVQLPNLRRFAKWSGLGRGVSRQFRSLSVSGPVDWTTTRMAFAKANISVNGNHATGALTIKHAGERLSLDGTLGFQELDLGRNWPEFAAPRDPQKGTNEPHILTVLDADLRLSATKVYGPTFEMGRAAVSIALNKGRLQADIAELEIEGGIAGGQVAVDLSQASPQAVFKTRLKGVDAGRVLASSLRRNALLGRSNLAFDGTFGRQTAGERLPTLSGRGSFELAEPGRIGIDLHALIHAARSSPTVGWAAANKGGMPVDMLVARFRLLNGALTVESVQARSGASFLVGSGQLDVPARLMDVSIAAGPSSTGEAPITAQDILLLRGTWDAPAISLLPRAKQTTSQATPVRAH
ncbi:MAG: AsmA-like C-terminal region-containing protein [Hyphomicrobiaceae bacterium]